MTQKQFPPPGPDEKRWTDVSRRTFLKGAGATIAAVGVGGAAGLATGQDSVPAPSLVGPGKTRVTLNLNGAPTTIEIEPWQTLLDTLRDHVGLTGAKRVCDRGSCGGCTVLVDGLPMNACSLLTIDVDARVIRTVEGIANGETLSAVQQAFVECDAAQCGFCTPGMIVACTALLARNPHPSRAEIAEGIAGNLCRCGTYQNIFEAVERAAAKTQGGRSATL
ncbi:MAG: (2Fe-2S)-binding protein [Planctomycetes bacterium]|nr:(2Fe-2S)-binding protein [Planctomycetota bacterium]